jgi:hypothetical protein
MPQLPDRPDLAQLRRQARELLRAAADGDADAIRRVRQVSEKTTLSTAQLALTIFNSGGYWVWSSGGWWVMPEV